MIGCFWFDGGMWANVFIFCGSGVCLRVVVVF